MSETALSLPEIIDTRLNGETVDTRVRLVRLDDLHLSDWNPRVASEERLDNLKKTIVTDPDFLWSRPICARSNGEIYAGHRRWEVLKQLWDKPTVAWRRAAGDAGIAPGTVPAVVADVPERLAWERGMRDNAQWGDYDDALLLAHMQRIVGARTSPYRVHRLV
jgi:ParB-like chromosome segregation protein Spo0J